MAEAETWAAGELGTVRGRIDPATYIPPEGTYVYMLGTERGGYQRRFAIGDLTRIEQEESPGGGDKLIRIRALLRGPQRMPILSDDENFALSNGQTLVLSVDGGVNQTVTFLTADFASIGAARAFEVAGIINRDITGARAYLSGDGNGIGVISDTLGRRSKIEVIGGTAAAALGFQALAWRARMLIDTAELFSTIIEPGDLRDLADFGGALENFTPPFTIAFELGVVAL